ncbi:MAG: DedA family protein [Alphaproteobacteria bacterium]|nr:DedA family protein [Alphaproteobacteria bacterium]
MLKKLYNWMLEKAGSPRAVPALAAISFIESSMFPLPPDIMLIPMCLANRQKAFWFAFVCSVASVIGGLFGYAIGYFLYETVGVWVLNLYGGADEMYATFQKAFDQYGFWLVMMAGFTPFPFKVITICSGLTKLNIGVFVLASAISRSSRFFLEALLIKIYGDKIRDVMEKHLEVITTSFFVLLVGGFFLIRFII